MDAQDRQDEECSRGQMAWLSDSFPNFSSSKEIHCPARFPLLPRIELEEAMPRVSSR